MKIWFEQSGGLAGITISSSVDTNSLPSTQREMIERIVSSTSFFNLASRISPPRGSADFLHYVIKVEDRTGSHTVEFTDLSMVSELKPLVKFMREKALSSSRVDTK